MSSIPHSSSPENDTQDGLHELDNEALLDSATVNVSSSHATQYQNGAEAPDDAPPPPPPPPPTDDEDAADSLLLRDVGPVSYGLVDELAQFWHELDGAPIELHRTAQLVTVASVLHNARLMPAFTAPLGITPNVYAAAVAPSSTSRKSTTLRRVHTMLWGRGSRQDGTTAAKPLLNCTEYPGFMSPEGLLEAVADNGAGLVLQDEIGQLFGAHKRAHTEGLNQVLTQLYDGYAPPKRLVSKTLEFPEHLHVNILGATTPARFSSVTRALDWDDGFLVRWLFQGVQSDVDFYAEPTDWTQAHAKQMRRWQNELAKWNEKPDTVFAWAQPDDFKQWQTWYADNMTAARDSSSRDAAILARYATYALKFCLVLSVANGHKWGTVGAGVVDSAINLAEYYMVQLHWLREGLDERRVDGALVRKIFDAVPHIPGETTARLVQQYANIGDAATRDDALAYMKEKGWLDVWMVGRSTRVKRLVDMLPQVL